MSNETRIWALFEEANPVPDIYAMDPERTEPTAYLATLEKRSSEVTQIETKVDEPDKTQKAWFWGAAAALMVIAGLIAVLTSGSSEEPPVATDPSPASSGSWSSGSLSVVFEDDQYAFVLDGVLVEHGTYVAESDPAAIVYTSAEDSPGCAPGEEGRWSFEAGGGSSITLSPGDDDCFFRAFIVGPSITMAADSPIDVTGLPTELNLEGKWGDEATGLEITGNDYAIAIDGEVVDRGTYELQMSPYLLVLESESTDATCATATYGLSIEGGEVLALENNRIGEDECTARSGIGMRPLESGGTFEIPDAGSSGSNDG